MSLYIPASELDRVQREYRALLRECHRVEGPEITVGHRSEWLPIRGCHCARCVETLTKDNERLRSALWDLHDKLKTAHKEAAEVTYDLVEFAYDAVKEEERKS